MNEPAETLLHELREAMWVPRVPNDADRYGESALSALAGWKKIHVAAILAGLLTDVRYQANAVRLDWLQRLVLSRSTGRIKPVRNAMASILNSAFDVARVNRLEDPIEDTFCSVVPTSRGDRLIFDGNWEHAAAYTDTLIQAFELLPESQIKQTALDAVDTLLRLSDALAKRSQAARGAYHLREPSNRIALPSSERLKALARRVRFSDSDLEELSISSEQLVPFLMKPGLAEYVGSSLPGNSPLDFYPLLQVPNGILVAHPGVMSLAARSVLIQTRKAWRS